jgi:hypothetical protein
MSTRRARKNQLDMGENNFDDDASCEIERDSTASRALLKVQMKLKGQTDDSFASVEGHVESIIQKATSPALLSRLFKGWQAYL